MSVHEQPEEGTFNMIYKTSKYFRYLNIIVKDFK